MNKKLKNLISLNQNVKIYIPSTTDINKEVDTSLHVEQALSLLASSFGGATSYQAFGAWLSASGQLIKEKVTVCEAFCKEIEIQEKIEDIYDFCLKLKIDLKQEAIALEVNGTLHLV